MSELKMTYFPVSDVKLRPLVQMIWSLQTESPCMMPGAIAPDAQVEFVFFLRGHGHMRLHRVERRMTTQPKAFAYTQLQGCLEIGTSGPAEFVAFRTNLAVANTLLSFPANEAADTCLDLSEVWPNQLPSLMSQLRRTPLAHQGKLLEQFISNRLTDTDMSATKTFRLYDWMLANGTYFRLSKVAPSLGLTRRTLERQFKSAGGASPASIAKFGRFLHACQQIRIAPSMEIGEIAHQFGYTDHAHFSNRFKQYALITPSEFRELNEAYMVNPVELMTPSI